MGVKRTALLVLVATTAAAGSAVGGVVPTPILQFEPTTAVAGQFVSVQLTVASRRDRQPVRLYLFRRGAGAEPRSRFDPRLHFLGLVTPDARGRGALGVRVPPLDTGTYSVAVWCPGCDGSGLSVPRRTSLSLSTDARPDSCPATTPGGLGGKGEGLHGNGLLSVFVGPDGANVGQREPDGTVFDKLGWIPRTGLTGTLRVSGQRLDAPSAPMRVLGVNWGNSFPSGKGSWMSAVVFPAEGCWRLTGRVRDIALTYVVRVVGA